METTRESAKLRCLLVFEYLQRCTWLSITRDNLREIYIESKTTRKFDKLKIY